MTPGGGSPDLLSVIHPASFTAHTNQVRLIKQRMSEFHVQGYSLEELEMIDVVQRLGIDHLFHKDIGEALQRHHTQLCHGTLSEDGSPSSHSDDCHDLHEASLRFRLLRQMGYNVSSNLAGIINNSDKQGLMSLFEASQLGMRGDDTMLDKANTLCMQFLNNTTTVGNYVDESSIARLLRTLRYPQHKTLARFTADDLLCELQSQKGWMSELALLAKMEYAVCQNVYQNEIKCVLRWWEELGLGKQLKFARDQALKWYMWSLAILQAPIFSEQRIQLAKPISFIYIIDDIFDVHGTPEDLSRFTAAVKRWEIDESLPQYMKICLKALFDTTADISQSIFVKYGHRPDQSLHKAWANLLDAYLLESKCMTSGCLPQSQEYLQIATITSGVPLTLVHLLFLLGEKDDETLSNASRERYQKIITSTGTILRLWNDLGNAKDGDQDGEDGWYLQCYMNEHIDISIDEARKHVHYLISNEWKNINKACLLLPHEDPSTSNKNFVRGCLDLARMSPLMYNYNEKHSLPCLEKLMDSLLYRSYI